MSTDTDSAALVGFLQKFGSSKSTLGSQRLMVLLAETAHALKRADDQRDGSKLGLRVTDFILIQRERLKHRERQRKKGSVTGKERDGKKGRDADRQREE